MFYDYTDETLINKIFTMKKIENGNMYIGNCENVAYWYCSQEGIFLDIEAKYDDCENVVKFSLMADITNTTKNKEFTSVHVGDFDTGYLQSISVNDALRMFFTKIIAKGVEGYKLKEGRPERQNATDLYIEPKKSKREHFKDLSGYLNISSSAHYMNRKQDVKSYISFMADWLQMQAKQLRRSIEKSKISLSEVVDICENLEDFDEKLLDGIEQAYWGDPDENLYRLS